MGGCGAWTSATGPCRQRTTKSESKSDVNGATWTAAKSTSGPWSRLWSRFRRRDTRSRNNTRQTLPDGAIFLIGAFEDLRAFNTAKGKLAVVLEPAEYLCIPSGEIEPLGSFWAELSRPFARLLGGSWTTEEQITGIDAPEAARACMGQVLSSGGGLVLICAAHRFPRACEIIHAAGGRVGLPETAAVEGRTAP